MKRKITDRAVLNNQSASTIGRHGFSFPGQSSWLRNRVTVQRPTSTSTPTDNQLNWALLVIYQLSPFITATYQAKNRIKNHIPPTFSNLHFTLYIPLCIDPPKNDLLIAQEISPPLIDSSEWSRRPKQSRSGRGTRIRTGTMREDLLLPVRGRMRMGERSRAVEELVVSIVQRQRSLQDPVHV